MAASPKSIPEEENNSDRKPRPAKGKKITTITYPEITNFDDLFVSNDLLRGIYSYGFEKPSWIQQRVILPIMDGRHVIVQSPSGTGKTASFAIGILHRIDFDSSSSSSSSSSSPSPQALVLCPTRELAHGIKHVISLLGVYLQVRSLLILGGSPPTEEIQAVKENPHVLVGTCGRMELLLRRKGFDLSNTKVIVLDELDEMLSRGFKEQIGAIFSFGWNFPISTTSSTTSSTTETTTKSSEINYPPHQPQVVVCSATFPCDVVEWTKKFTINPLHIQEKREEKTLDGIKQYYVYVEKEEWKLDTLCDLYETMTITQSVVYCNTRRKVEFVAEQLRQRHIPVSALTGENSCDERKKILEDFRCGASRILITTDLLARGIDVACISLVINYDLPINRENYVHRIGRSGRFGRKGVAINFVAEQDVQTLKDIEGFYNTRIDELPMEISDLI